MYLIIDIGNSYHKAALYDEEGRRALLLNEVQLLPEHIMPLYDRYTVSHAIISVVGTPNPALLPMLHKKGKLLVFDNTTPLPIKNTYLSPNTLGVDRIAAAVAVNDLFPDQNVLLIQAGSCLVFDFINSRNEYCGGSIAPGIAMRLRALHSFTGNLPLLENIDLANSEEIPIIGCTTDDSILSGVINGILCEINGMAEHYNTLYNPLKIVVTGGNGFYLQKSIKNTIFAGANLVLAGLHKILQLNVEKEKNF